jgi:hypothetical protein
MPVDKIFQLNMICTNYFEGSWGVPRTHQYGTRLLELDPVVEPMFGNKYFNRLSVCILPRLWNLLHQELKTLEDKDEVKIRVKKWLLEKY